MSPREGEVFPAGFDQGGSTTEVKGVSMSISETIVADFEEEMATTRKVLEALPAERFDWKPHDKSMSLGQLGSHIAESPTWVQSMLKGDLDFADVEDSYVPFAAANRTELLEAFDRNVSALKASVSAASEEAMTEIWTMRHGEKVLMQAPRHLAIRRTAIHHAIHHRGQLTVYLRLMDVPVPSTFGPTADDPGGF